MKLVEDTGGGAGSGHEDAIARAVVVPAVFVMHADGSAHPSEMIQLANLCSFSPIFHSLGEARTQAVLEQVVHDVRGSDPRSVLDWAIALLSPALRETALLFAMRVAMANGDLEDDETQLLVGIAGDMGLPRSAFDTMFKVIAAMQRPATA